MKSPAAALAATDSHFQRAIRYVAQFAEELRGLAVMPILTNRSVVSHY
jgi:hypothetical protein